MKLKNSKFSSVKNIIFDFGNVLLDIDISLSIKAFKQLGLTGFKAEDIHPHNAGVFLELELGNISTEEFITKLRGSSAKDTPTDFEIYNAWNMLILPFDFNRFRLLDQLRQNYKVYLLSNTNWPHREFFLQKFNAENPDDRTFESYFDQCFYSDAMRMRKPDHEIYIETLKQARITAGETLFIDDNECNLVSAGELGIHTHHLIKPETVHDLFQ